MAKKAILVVSFGTSVNATREKTIDRIEADIQKLMTVTGMSMNTAAVTLHWMRIMKNWH